jgi:hypothetical protein
VQVSSFSGNCVAKFSKILPQSANPSPTASILFFEETEKSLNRGHHPAFCTYPLVMAGASLNRSITNEAARTLRVPQPLS